MNLAIAATGVTFGIVDMGIQALILKTWGHNERKVYLSFDTLVKFWFLALKHKSLSTLTLSEETRESF